MGSKDVLLKTASWPKIEDSSNSEWTWCTVEQDGRVFQAKVIHLRRGKFRIIHDNMGGAYLDRIVDASDIYSCTVERSK